MGGRAKRDSGELQKGCVREDDARKCLQVDLNSCAPCVKGGHGIPQDPARSGQRSVLSSTWHACCRSACRKSGTADSVTWMGVWKGPSSPCYRRVDIKIYPAHQLAFAVNYFGSSKDFCKALRCCCCCRCRRIHVTLLCCAHPAS
jgi:hypothetical protein